MEDTEPVIGTKEHADAMRAWETSMRRMGANDPPAGGSPAVAEESERASDLGEATSRNVGGGEGP
jgi:hypothetical protein